MSASARVVVIGASARASHDRARDVAGEALLAERRDDLREVALGGRIDQIGRARARAAHAHVERAVVAEREAALGLIELHRGDAEVEQDAVDRLMAEIARDLRRDWRSDPRPA